MESIWTRRVVPMLASQKKPIITHASHQRQMFLKGYIISRETFDWWKARIQDTAPVDGESVKRSMQALWEKCR